MPDLLPVILDYIIRGWAPIPIPHRSKGPVIDAWQGLKVTAASAGAYFNGARQNVGVVLGKASGGLTDIDLDCPEAIAAAAYVLPRTAVFGRPSKPASHWVYKTNLCETQDHAAIKFMSSDKSGLLEIRCGGGDKAAQTVFPPSVHPGGETIEWAGRGPNEIADVDGDELIQHARRLAAASELARHYPKVGARHDAAFVLGGFLARCGLSPSWAATFAEAVGAASLQPGEKRRDMGRTERDGANAEKRAGFPMLAETFGEGPAKKVADWLGYEQPAARGGNDEDKAPPWSTPKPLPAGLLPVPPFDLAFLPKSIAPWVEDIADRMQCPLDFVAVPAMVALGSVLGRKIAIRPQRKTDWYEVPNLWGLVIGPPGARKSPAMSEAMKPIKRLETKAREGNEAALAAHRYAVEEHKLRKEAAAKRAREVLKKDAGAATQLCLDEPKEPKAKRYIVEDATYEKLGEILADNPNGVLAFRDEIVSLLKTLDREEYASARGFFLSAWTGTAGYTFDRIIRGTMHIEAACVSLLGSTQPGKIAEYVHRALDGGEGDDGMIQRFGMLAWPDQTPEWREIDRYPNAEAKNKAWAAFDDLDKLDWQKVGAEKDSYEPVPFLSFDDEAQRLFSAWHRELEMSLRGEELSPALKGHFAKYRKLVPALVLINHLADEGYGDVRAVALERAISFSRYLEAHARRAYSAGSEGETAAAAAILSRIRKGFLTDGFSARDVYHSKWSNLTNREHVKGALNLLVDFGWLQEKAVKTGGRPSAVYFINPRIGERN